MLRIFLVEHGTLPERLRDPPQIAEKFLVGDELVVRLQFVGQGTPFRKNQNHASCIVSVVSSSDARRSSIGPTFGNSYAKK